MTVLVRVDVATDDTVPVPLDGVLVRVYNNSDVFVTEGDYRHPIRCGSSGVHAHWCSGRRRAVPVQTL
jgi:hypothetical protein